MSADSYKRGLTQPEIEAFIESRIDGDHRVVYDSLLEEYRVWSENLGVVVAIIPKERGSDWLDSIVSEINSKLS